MDRVITGLLESDWDDLGRYVVEVSSPGLFRRLRRPGHFRRFVGEIVKATVLTGEGEATRQVRGVLLKADEDSFELQADGAQVERIPYAVLRSAHLDPDLTIGKPRRDAAVKERKPKRSGKGT